MILDSSIENSGRFNCKSKIKNSLCLVPCILLFALPSFAQTYHEANAEGTKANATTPQVYHESALRRFEIIFTISLPFTALYSYLGVRGAEMIGQRKISPNLKGTDWDAIGGLTVLFSGFIAFWDWLHTRGRDISETEVTPRGQPEPSTSSRIQYPVSNIQLIFLSIGF